MPRGARVGAPSRCVRPATRLPSPPLWSPRPLHGLALWHPATNPADFLLEDGDELLDHFSEGDVRGFLGFDAGATVLGDFQVSGSSPAADPSGFFAPRPSVGDLQPVSLTFGGAVAPNNEAKCKELAAQRDRLRAQLSANRNAITNANGALIADTNGAVVGSTLDQVNQLAQRVDASSRGMDVILTAASEMNLRTIGRGLEHFSAGFSSISLGAGFGFGISDIQNGNYLEGASQIYGSSIGTASLIGGRLATDGVISKGAGNFVRVAGLWTAGAQVGLFFGQELYAGASHSSSLKMQQATIEQFQARVDQQLSQLREVYNDMKTNGCN